MEESDRLARRARREQEVRRRRLSAILALIAALAAVVVAAALAGGGEGGHKRARTQPARSVPRPGGPHRSTPPPSATIAASAPGAHLAPHEAVPILMYHVIGTPRPDTPLPELWVTPRDFRGHVRALAGRGYHAVTLQQVWDAWHRGGRLPSKPVVFSFDDGYTGQYTQALPALRAAGWTGVLNLKLGNLRDLHAERVKAMIAAGWEIDSHTINHPDLTSVGAGGLRVELEQSRARLRREFGVPANFFCYPAGEYDATVVAAVKRAGYLAATTTDSGFARTRDTYVLGRVRVNGSDSPSDLVKKLAALGANPDAAPVLRGGRGR
ncbi:MAG: polysaccharide deacetylase family protein [Actinomycetota bacterium]|nr:polysaccharide deacetylase family protein [Actinomycetota bacterium]